MAELADLKGELEKMVEWPPARQLPDPLTDLKWVARHFKNPWFLDSKATIQGLCVLPTHRHTRVSERERRHRQLILR